MENARFWTGIVILMSPLTGIVIANSADLLTPAPSVEGRVIYQGRPVSGGMICLVSEDRERIGDMFARIGPDGRFACRPRSWNAEASRTRFQIHLFPDPRRPRGDDRTGSFEPSPQMNEIAESQPERHRAQNLSARVVLASMRSPTPVPSHPIARSVAPGTAVDTRPRKLEVSLGAESIHIDIDLDR